MPAHVSDSVFFKDLFGSPAMRVVFDDRNLLQKWLDFEAALARVQARYGLIPAEAAEEITRQARAERMDVAAIKEGVDRTVHPLVPVIWQLSRQCEGTAGNYVHWGATTQDVMDTAIVLQIREALVLIEATVDDLRRAMQVLARTHQHTPMAGRTHGQQALPITFGFKVSVWLAELGRHRERLQQVRERVLVGELGGAVGTLASLAENQDLDVLAMRAAFMEELGLNTPPIAWHNARDSIAEFAVVVSMFTALMGRIAHEVILLQKQEFGELEEPFEKGKVGSSTMPQKRNPMLCESILTLARLCRQHSATAVDTLLHNEHERDWSSFQMEWAYLPELCVMGHGAMLLTQRLLQGLRVNTGRMRQNLDLTGGLLLAERIMLTLGRHIGRQQAHDIVYECAMQAYEQGQSFADLLVSDDRVQEHLDEAQIRALLDPEQYTGMAAAFVDHVLEESGF